MAWKDELPSALYKGHQTTLSELLLSCCLECIHLIVHHLLRVTLNPCKNSLTVQKCVFTKAKVTGD